MREFDRKQAERVLKYLDEESGLFPQFAFSTAGDDLKLIGKGGFSSVYEMYNRERPELKYALKVTGFGDRYADPESFRNTSRLWWLLGRESKYVVRVLETAERYVTFDENGEITASGEKPEGKGDELALQFVLTERLSPVIEKDRFGNASLCNNKPSSEKDVTEFALHIGLALLNSHSENVLHRDVKLENIFWDEANGVYKLGDFGIAKYALEGVAETICYTDGYGAPEIEKRLYDNYDDTADIYSFGITLYLLLNDLKFPGSDGYFPNVRLQYDPDYVFPAPAHASPEMTAIIRKMCSFEPDDRYSSVREVLEKIAGLGENAVIEALTDFGQTGAETETYHEEDESGGAKRRPGNIVRKKSLKSIKADKEFNDYILNTASVFHIVTLSLILPLLFKGGVLSDRLSVDMVFWLAVIALLFQSVLQKIEDLEIVFGIFALFLVGLSAYTSGFTCIHLVFALCILSRMSAFSFAAVLGSVIWILITLSGKPAFLELLETKDISWFLLGLFFTKLLCFMHLKLLCAGASSFRIKTDRYIRIVFFAVCLLSGICVLIMRSRGIMIPEEIHRMHLVRNVLIFMPVTYVIIWFENLFFSDEENNG